jgi:hypothetical protein
MPSVVRSLLISELSAAITGCSVPAGAMMRPHEPTSASALALPLRTISSTLEQARHAEVDMFADQIVERGRADTCISLMPAAPALHSDSPPVSALHRTVQRIKAEMVAWRSHLRADVP